MATVLLLVLLFFGAVFGEPLDPDHLSQRYRNWSYYPTWVVPPACLNPATCAAHCNITGGSNSGCTTDVFQLIQLESEVAAGIFRGIYLQFDGVGYETYMAITTDMVHFDLASPGVIFSPRTGRPPFSWNATPGEFDYGGTTFIGPVLQSYAVSGPRVLQASPRDGKYYYAYGAYPTYGYESAPGANGFASSRDGLVWERATPLAFMDTNPANGAQPWEQGQVYAPFLIPTPDGQLADFYNAGSHSGNEQSGVAYLPGGIAALPGFDFDYNISQWVRDPLNPTLPNDPVASFQASDPKVFWDDEQQAWVLIYFCNGDGTDGGADICIAFSSDQRHWAKAAAPLYKHGGHPAGLDACHAHKVWLTGRDGVLYLYYTGVSGPGCGTRGILLLTSRPIAAP